MLAKNFYLLSGSAFVETVTPAEYTENNWNLKLSSLFVGFLTFRWYVFLPVSRCVFLSVPCSAVVWEPGDSEMVEWLVVKWRLCLLCGVPWSWPRWALLEHCKNDACDFKRLEPWVYACLIKYACFSIYSHDYNLVYERGRRKILEIPVDMKFLFQNKL